MGRKAKGKVLRRRSGSLAPRSVSPQVSSSVVASPVKVERWYGYTEEGCTFLEGARPVLDDMGYPEPEPDAEIGYISARRREDLQMDFGLLEEEVPVGSYLLEDKRMGRFEGAFAKVEEAKQLAQEQLGIVRWFERKEL